MTKPSRRKALIAALLPQGRVQVRTLDLEYVPGDYVAWNGVKGGGPRGYGWDSCPIHSEYLLAIQGPAGPVKVRVDRAFKEAIGRLSPKRRAVIRSAMPSTVTLVMGDDPWYGKEQILVSEEDQAKWVEEVKAVLASRSTRAPRLSLIEAASAPQLTLVEDAELRPGAPSLPTTPGGPP